MASSTYKDDARDEHASAWEEMEDWLAQEMDDAIGGGNFHRDEPSGVHAVQLTARLRR